MFSLQFGFLFGTLFASQILYRRDARKDAYVQLDLGRFEMPKGYQIKTQTATKMVPKSSGRKDAYVQLGTRKAAQRSMLQSILGTT